MKTENSQNVFSVSITYNSKIRELSNGNRVIVCQTIFLSWVPQFLSYELWKLRIELRKLLNQTPPKYFVWWEEMYHWVTLNQQGNMILHGANCSGGAKISLQGEQD